MGSWWNRFQTEGNFTVWPGYNQNYSFGIKNINRRRLSDVAMYKPCDHPPRPGGKMLGIWASLARFPGLPLWGPHVRRTRSPAYLRNDVSRLTMPEARVRAFEPRLSVDRSGLRLLQAKRHFSGAWDVSSSIDWRFSRRRELRRAQLHWSR
jgi:hypothetical protein